jgi:hypothetical protein
MRAHMEMCIHRYECTLAHTHTHEHTLMCTRTHVQQRQELGGT